MRALLGTKLRKSADVTVAFLKYGRYTKKLEPPVQAVFIQLTVINIIFVSALKCRDTVLDA